jgi:hypothetical protein
MSFLTEEADNVNTVVAESLAETLESIRYKVEHKMYPSLARPGIPTGRIVHRPGPHMGNLALFDDSRSKWVDYFDHPKD